MPTTSWLPVDAIIDAADVDVLWDAIFAAGASRIEWCGAVRRTVIWCEDRGDLDHLSFALGGAEIAIRHHAEGKFYLVLKPHADVATARAEWLRTGWGRGQFFDFMDVALFCADRIALDRLRQEVASCAFLFSHRRR